MEHIREILEKLELEQTNIKTSMDGMPTDSKREAKDRLILIEQQMQAYRDRSRKMIDNSNLGRRFKDRTFENFDRNKQPLAYDKCFRYAKEFDDNRGEGLLLVGNPGTGKTHLAASITNYIIANHGVAVKFGNFIDILDDIKKSFHSDEDVVRELKRMPLLVIDDLGKERRSEWSEMVIYNVINGRYEDYMPTIITTNLLPSEIEKRFGEATLSRISEMCTCIVVHGDDVRREGSSWDGL